MKDQNKISLPNKIATTLLCTLGSAGVIFFFEAFMHLNSQKAGQVFWAVLFGISFSYILGYKLEISGRK